MSTVSICHVFAYTYVYPQNPVRLNFILLLLASCPLTGFPSGMERCFTNGTMTTEYCWYNDAQAAQVGIVCAIIGRVNHEVDCDRQSSQTGLPKDFQKQFLQISADVLNTS